jgi:predicted nucleic acid-binding protein
VTLARVLLDSTIFIYAVGGEHHYRDPCRQLIRALRASAFPGEVSVLAVEETLHQRTRRTGDRVLAREIAESIPDLCTIHDLTIADTRLGLRLYGESRRLNARDAMHAATALNRGIPTIISPDSAFDDVAGLERLDPIEAADRLDPGWNETRR